MRNGHFHALGVVALLATGCIYTSGSPWKSPLANSPKGVAGFVIVDSHVYEGELLTVTQADLTLRTSEAVVLVPYPEIVRGGFAAVEVYFDSTPSPTHQTRLRYASRYPYGIPDVAMKAILSKLGRSAPDTVRAR